MSILDTGVNRRQVLKGFLIAGPTLTIAARLGFSDGAGAFPAKTDEAPDVLDFTDIFFAAESPSAYDLKIEIKPDNRVYFEFPRMDIGQGVITSTTMMVADNLDVPLESMDTVLSPAEQKRGAYITGGSKNTRVFWEPIRVIGAQMRGQLMAAAATKMGVPVSALRTGDGHVIATDGRKLSYGQLTADAAKLPPAKAAMPKSPSDYRYVGKPQVKYQAREIATGKWQYSTDLFSSKQFLPTVLAMPATHGATVVSIDDAEAKKIPGVIAITHIPGMPDYLIPEAVAVTAETTGIAKKAKDALKIKWSAGPMDSMSDAQIDELLSGIIDKVASPGEGIEATFRWPYVTHAPMQENAGCADVRKDSAEIWGSDQIPTTGQRHVAETLGLKLEQVQYNCLPGGGAFGRHTHHDETVMAAQVSQRVGRPIKLQWLREEGIKHGRCRPVSIHHVKATIANGEVVSFEHRMAGSELDLRHGLGDMVSGYVTEYNNAGASNFFFTHTQKLAYNFGPTAITLKEQLLAKATAPWRVVYSGPVGGSNEILIDEVARALGKDEFEFRMQYLESDRDKAVLEKAAHEAQWGKKLPNGVAQGIGMHDEYKSISAYIMEIDTRGKTPRMTNVTIAVDCGYCVNPSNTENQMLGQAIDGFATVFQSGLHIDNGATRESNFHNFKWPRMFDSPPEASVHILPSSMTPPGGIGEVGTPAATAAASCGGGIFFTPDVTALTGDSTAAWTQVFDDDMAVLHAPGDDRAAMHRSREDGGCAGGSWHQVSRDNRFLFRTVMGRNPGSTDSFDTGTAKVIYSIDISALIASAADGKIDCTIDTRAEIRRGQGDEADCPRLLSVLDVEDATTGGPHWAAIDNHSLTPTGAPTRLVFSNSFVARTGVDGNHRMYMVDVDPTTGALTYDQSFRDETDGAFGVNFNRRHWPKNPDAGFYKPHAMVWVCPPGICPA